MGAVECQGEATLPLRTIVIGALNGCKHTQVRSNRIRRLTRLRCLGRKRKPRAVSVQLTQFSLEIAGRSKVLISPVLEFNE